MWLLFTAPDLMNLSPEPTYSISLVEECLRELPQDESALFNEPSIFVNDSTGRCTEKLNNVQRKISTSDKNKLKSSLMRGVKEIVTVARYVLRLLTPPAVFASHEDGY
jgi:hypothetical protein